MHNQHLNTRRYVLFCVITFALFTPLTGFSQAQSNSTTLNRLSEALHQQATSKPVEKVYLQLDKNFFVTGETIWIKAYVFTGGLHQLSDWSKIVNVALVDDQGKTKKLIKLPVVNGASWGDIALPDSLKGGKYTIKAYTKWMQNDKADYFFNQPVTIVSGLKQYRNSNKMQVAGASGRSKQVSQPAVNNKPDLQFMPESGKLIAGIKSKVAFKAVGVNGLGIDVKGVVIDDQGKEVAQFASQHRGMGAFSLYPEVGKSYKAQVNYPDGATATVPLAIEQEGYILSVNNTETDGLPVRISTTANSPYKNLVLLGHVNGLLCYSANISMPGQVTTLTIPKSRFPSGIVQFSLLSADHGVPLSERLAFIQNKDALKVNLKTTQSYNSPRGLVNVELQSLSPDSLPVAGNFSVAVVAEDKVPQGTSVDATIFSHILLTSDLKGNIEDAPYYFDANNTNARADLDLLMLTQGYRKFDLQLPVAKGDELLPEKALSISGTVKDFSGKPVANAKVTLFTKIDNVMPLDTLTDKQGHFSFNNLIFADSTRFVINAITAKKSNNLNIELDKANLAVEVYNGDVLKNTDEKSLAAQKEYVDNAMLQLQGRVLKAVMVKGKKTPSIIPKEFQYSNNLNGPGNADFIVRSADLENRGGDLGTVLQGIITGVRIIDDKAYSIANSAFKGGTDGSIIMNPMNIIYNGMNYGTNFRAINPADIETIEVLRTARFTGVYGSSGAPGVLVITSKRNINNVTKEPGVIAHIPNGYYQSRMFYSPLYNTEAAVQQADLRTTVYWQPNIYTAADGSGKISYYNSDLKGSYRVIVEGTDKDGRLGRQVLRYEVK